jgi:hypothetical protein
LNFLPDSKVAVLFFKTAAFNHSATPPFLIVEYSGVRVLPVTIDDFAAAFQNLVTDFLSSAAGVRGKMG